MLIKSVTVNHFRNLSPQKIEFQKGINLLFGKNAQGKTNTLEAIYLTTIGRSARTRKDVEMIAHGHNDLLVKLEFSHAGISHTLEFRLTRGQKQFFLDGNKFSRISDVIGNFGSVYFAPDSLNLVQGSPAGRRKFMDIINCQLSKNYLRNLQTFQKILEQRNALLKKVSAFEELEVWDEQLAKFGTKIFIARKRFCEKLSALVKDINKDLSGGEVLQVFYQSPLKLKKTSCENDDNMIDAETLKEVGAENAHFENLSTENLGEKNACSAEEDTKKLQEQYLLELESSFEKDKILGYTTFGVQSDDFSLKLGGQDARKCASQGQQRTASLSLKLAELEILKEEYGDYPVLLLDDVFSELDEFRRTKLLERIKDIQCLISSTDVIAGVQCSLFEVSGGKVTFMGENSF